MTDVPYIQVPLWYLPFLVVIPAGMAAGVVSWLKHRSKNRVVREKDPDWSIPPLTQGSGQGTSLIHRWDVRCKIVTMLAYSFAVASLRHLDAAVAAVLVSLAVLMVARVSLHKVVLRLVALAGFLGMLLVVMPLTVPHHPGDVILVFGSLDWLGVNMRGVILAATIAAKATAIALLMEPLLSTAPLPVTLYGLSRLGVPDMVGQMVLLSYRYLHVFSHEARRMTAGMQARGFVKKTNMDTLRALANFLGMLFVRSFERTERVFDAMQARGYKGRFPEPGQLQIRLPDILLTGVWIAAGTALVFYDCTNV
ncbi:MAG TPA: cobalt ECF transporter T component CbiQ [Desulfotignum sp.]|nr:cobalt ECF transporter T component CbiQ [Desulfotignum sp.]